MGALLLVLALAVPARAAEPPSPVSSVREHLKALVRLDTSNPPGNEILAANYLKAQLDKEGIPSKVYVSSGTRASLIARLKGSGAKKALILMCHTDVVPADKKEWATEPFVPVEKEGYLYGRGTADNKGLCAAELSILIDLKRSKAALSRDVVFFAEADEESGARDRHIDWLLREHGSELDGEFAVNEGGNTVWDDGRVSEIRVEAAEKEYMDVTLRVAGQAGHASIPRADNAVVTIARAVVRLSDYRFPARLEGVVRRFFERQEGRTGPEVKAALSDVLRASPGPELDRAADRLSAVSPEFGAMLRDTVTPTILSAGYKSNVIPAEAEAVLNARLLPGRDPRDFIRELSAAIADPLVEVRAQPPTRPPVPPMPTDTALYKAVEEAAAELAPGVPVMPFMAAWTTDAQDLRARGVIVYGIEAPLSSWDEGVHSKNERISLAALDWYVEFLRLIVLKVAAADAPKPSRPGAAQ